jgi:hypothetical protein
MIRTPNPLDTRLQLPSRYLASGGANCSTTTSSCSCIASTVATSVLAGRIVAGEERAHPVAQPQATASAGRWRRSLAGAALPLALAALPMAGAFAPSPYEIHAAVLVCLGAMGLLFAALHRQKRPGWLGTKLLLTGLVLYPALAVAEMFAWLSIL